MKKLIIATFALLGVMSVQAQKGSFLLGTDFSYKRNQEIGSLGTGDAITFSPIVAYEFANNWYIGAKTDMEQIKIGDTKQFNNKVGGFFRYYKPLSNMFGVYADLGAGYQQEKTSTSGVIGFQRAYGYYIDFTPALFINFKNNFGLNFSIGGVSYDEMKYQQGKEKQNNVNVDFGKAIKIGVTKKLSF